MRGGLNRRGLLSVGLFAGVVLVPTSATAQALAGNLDQLRVLVKVGDTLSVTDGAGRETRGRVIGLSAATLELAVNEQQRTFTDNDIALIRQRRPDPLRNGALIGLGVGVGIGALCLIGAAQEEEIGGGWAAACLGIYAGLGAAVGVGMDAAIRGTRPIYARPSVPARGVDVRPLLGRGRAGVAASIAF